MSKNFKVGQDVFYAIIFPSVVKIIENKKNGVYEILTHKKKLKSVPEKYLSTDGKDIDFLAKVVFDQAYKIDSLKRKVTKLENHRYHSIKSR